MGTRLPRYPNSLVVKYDTRHLALSREEPRACPELAFAALYLKATDCQCSEIYGPIRATAQYVPGYDATRMTEIVLML